jgi:type II secretory pathway pseudopilin PulG
MMRTRGFTLLELVGVMLVVSIGFVGLADLFSNMSVGLTSAEAQQKTNHYVQACGELILQYRRDNGYCASSCSSVTVNGSSVTYLSSGMCSGLVDSGYTINVQGYNGSSSTGMCPSGYTCNDVAISATGPNGASSSATITLMSY